MGGRVYERKKRRMPCSLIFEGRKHSGLVLDVSPGGLFIQTSAKAEPGDRLDVHLSITGEADKVHMQVEVARKVVVPAKLLAVAHGGIGVRILSAPEPYYKFMEVLGIGADPGEFQARAKGREKKSASQPTQARSEPDTETDATSPEPEPVAEPEPNYRVRIKQTKGSRSRVLKVAADSEADAEWKALADVGDGWQVLDVKAL
jgi:hypothetical protein